MIKFKIFTWIFALGAFISIFNFYLSFVRYPIFCLLRKKEFYKFSSGIPLFGNIFNLVSIIAFWGTKIAILAAVFLLIDTGGLLWFAYSMLDQYFKKQKDEKQNP